uniref:Uncharacterized protein n=1 Tax=Oryza sativa subsp. japonica TaxID=39947 RepID=Q6H5I3_ORYSJ|nr:hypothetical protein [Oryza sativa Japonica Group]
METLLAGRLAARRWDPGDQPRIDGEAGEPPRVEGEPSSGPRVVGEPGGRPRVVGEQGGQPRVIGEPAGRRRVEESGSWRSIDGESAPLTGGETSTDRFGGGWCVTVFGQQVQ